MGAQTQSHSPESLIKALNKVATSIGKKTVSRRFFEKETGISERQIYKHFDSWNEFVLAAGLEPLDTTPISESELMEEMYNIFLKEERVTTRQRFERISKFSEKPYRKRWGSWDKTLIAFHHWIEQFHPEFPFINQLNQITDLSKLLNPIENKAGKDSGNKQY